MRPAAVIPMHDPDGIYFPLLEAITPALATLFERIYVSLTVDTLQHTPDAERRLASQPLFDFLTYKTPKSVGEDFTTLYGHAASRSHPDQLLHLCFIDRLAFALQGDYRTGFEVSIRSLSPAGSPLVFRRSARAWQTHPNNYHDIEQMATTAGEWAFGRSLDFAWCHLVLSASRLQSIIPTITAKDLSLAGQIMLQLRDDVSTCDVDWLAWEDPFILGRDPLELKAEREHDMAETRKRLGYIIPILRLIESAARQPKPD